jgi:hypothetical protein
MQCRRASRGFARALLAETFRPHFGAYTVTMNIAAELPAEGVGPEPFHIICENDIIRLHNLRRLINLASERFQCSRLLNFINNIN